MPDFTTFKEDHPFIRDVPVSSGAEGDKAFADVFGQAATKTISVAEAINKQYADELLLHDTNRLNEVGNQAKIEMRQNPAMANQIAKKASEIGLGIIKDSPSHMKEKLRSAYDIHVGSAQLEAAGLSFRQNKIEANRTLQQETPIRLSEMMRIQSPEQLEKTSKEFVSTFDNALASGTISQTYYNNTMQRMGIIYDHQTKILKKFQKGNMSAAEYSHATNYEPDNQTNGNPAARPSDETHNFIQDHYVSENTYAAAISDADRGVMPSESDFFGKAKSDQLKKVLYRYDGAMDAKSWFDVGKPEAWIKNQYQYLKSKPTKTEEETGAINYIENRFNEQKNNGYEDIVNTNFGAKIIQEHAEHQAAIAGTVFTAADPEQAELKKQIALHQNDLDKYYRLDAAADTRGTPSDQRNFMPDKAMIVQSAFDSGNPGGVINMVNQTPPDMAYYLTQHIKDGSQRAALWAVNLRRNYTGKSPDDATSQDIISAVMPGQDFSALKLPEGYNYSDSHIRKDLENKIRNSLNFTAMVPEGAKHNGGVWAQNTINAGVQYVKSQMIKNAKYDSSHVGTYINNYADYVNSGFDIYSGLNFSFNMNELRGNSKEDLSAVASFMMNKYHEDSSQKYSKLSVRLAYDMIPPHVVNMRNGKIAVISPDGSVLHQEPLTPSLISESKQFWDKNRLDMSNAVKERGKLFGIRSRASKDSSPAAAPVPVAAQPEAKPFTMPSMNSAYENGILEVKRPE